MNGHTEVTSPVKNIQTCWNDDKRMTAMYAPFRLRETNPIAYDSKMEFWQNSVVGWCMEKNAAVFTIRRLQEQFKRKDRVPTCLNIVIFELERQNQIKPKEAFLEMVPNESWTLWAVKSLVKKPMVWSFSKLKSVLLEQQDPSDVEYICIPFFKKKCDEILSKAEGSNQTIYNLNEVRQMLIGEVASDAMLLILRWMQIQNKVHLKKLENDDVLIKFHTKEGTDITDIDVSLYILHQNRLTLEKAIDTLELEKAEIVKTAKDYLKKGMRESAKSYLRRKKEVEKTIAKRVAAAENVEILLGKIQDASSDSKVIETYKVALSALKKTFKENGLSEDDVTNTMIEIQEVNEMHEEIQHALSEPITTTSEVELEKELADILKTNEKEKDIILPDVPTDSLLIDLCTPVKRGAKPSHS